MKETGKIGIIGLIALAGLMGSCSDGSVEPQENVPQSTVELMAMTTPFLDVQRMGTRADANGDGYDDDTKLPVGYVPFDALYPTSLPVHTTIGVFMTTKNPETAPTSLGTFIYNTKVPSQADPTTLISQWRTTIPVIEGTEYYVYGFMPHEDCDGATITALDNNPRGDYSQGAILTLNGYKTITAADACAIVGVRRATAAEEITGAASPVPLGQFKFVGGADNDNRMFVLLKHIYAGLHFKYHVGTEYSRLRTIKVKHVDLIATQIAASVDLTLTLRANTGGNDPLSQSDITYTLNTNKADYEVPVYDAADEYVVPVVGASPDPNPGGFLACFVPNSCDNFTLRTTYDVYDKEGELIRPNCVAENLLSSTYINQFGTFNAGDVFIVDILVQPDFYYQLSNNDLDNPTFKLTTTTTQP